MPWILANGNAAGNNYTSGNQQVLTFAQPATAGHLIVIGIVTWAGPVLAAGEVTVSDSLNPGAYAAAAWYQGALGGTATGLFWKMGDVGGTLAITVRVDRPAYLTLMAGEFGYSAPGNPGDAVVVPGVGATAGADGSGSVLSAGPLAAGADELAVLVVNGGSNFDALPDPTSGTLLLNAQVTAQQQAGSMGYIPGATGTVTPTLNLTTTTQSWSAIAAAFPGTPLAIARMPYHLLFAGSNPGGS